MLKSLAQVKNPHSLSNKLRQRRFLLFKKLIRRLPTPASSSPLKILDIGGAQNFWQKMNFLQDSSFQITLLNLTQEKTSSPHLISLSGNATNLKRFTDQEFDIVFSNSTIEHLFTFANQQKMANEVQRVGKSFFIQTPNKYFPLEPHFLFPFFQFLPLKLKIWLIRHFNLGWRRKKPSYQKAKKSVTEIRLLTKAELQQLFPQAIIWKEKFFGLTKSFIIYSGFNQTKPN